LRSRTPLLPHEEYFSDVERNFLDHGGRPHWGSFHSLKAEGLRPVYSMCDRFGERRGRMDPGGIFLNAYPRELLEGP
jgi:hypothetical protein